jgi:hypothetical protein
VCRHRNTSLPLGFLGARCKPRDRRAPRENAGFPFSFMVSLRKRKNTPQFNNPAKPPLLSKQRVPDDAPREKVMEGEG